MLTPLSAEISDDSPAQDANERHAGIGAAKLPSPDCGSRSESGSSGMDSAFDMGAEKVGVALRGLFGFELRGRRAELLAEALREV